MTDRELKRLSRPQLLEMLLMQAKEVSRLREELEQAQTQLECRRIQIEEAGSIAEASLKLNNVFDTAQAAADQYLQNIRQTLEETQKRCRQMEEDTRRRCEEMQRTAESEAAACWDAIREKIRDPFLDNESWQEMLKILEDKPGDPGKVRQ
ncbi:MAG: hypothetical protein IJN67_01530 [Oscillospiraceae bacterium]|nr:hypothetical protein [Oscillospiraceae bacterium]